MDEPQTVLLEFFKALSDPLRLQIAGQLAAKAQPAEALARKLGTRPAAVVRHLDYLVHAGLAAGPDGPQQAYTWRLDTINAWAGRLLHVPGGEVAVPEAVGDTYDRKVLKDYLRADGTLKEIPLQTRKTEVVLRYVFPRFETGRRYTEKEVNGLLAAVHPDSATLRRLLVDHGMLHRDSAGRAYWRD